MRLHRTPAPDTIERVTPRTTLRKQQARHLGRIARQPVQSTDSEFTPKFEADSRFDHKYGRLAERLYEEFVQQAHSTGDEKLIKLSELPSVLHGHYVATRLMSYGPGAYLEHLRTQPTKQSSMEELEAIMQHSKGVLKGFADRDIKSNTTFEISFGLLQYPPMYSDVPPFLIRPNEQQELEFGASPVIARRAFYEAMSMVPEEDLSGTDLNSRRCPALGIVLNTIWRRGVAECATDPQLFEADLVELYSGTPMPEQP